jgi:hypothetical protein
MKAKFNSPVKIFSSIRTQEFLLTIFLATVVITISNYVLMKKNQELRKTKNQ